MSTILDDILPADLLLPPKFEAFRSIQGEVTDFALYETLNRPKVMCGLPPGSGKSLSAHAIGAMSGVKYAVLTATRSLEDQMVEDGFCDGQRIVHIRGRSNYPCEMSGSHQVMGKQRGEVNCEEGSDDLDCDVAGTIKCPYTFWSDRAKNGLGILTNYQYWLNARAYTTDALASPEYGPVKLLICDECFPAGTLIDGEPIEQIKVGRLVTAYDTRSRKFVTRPVTQVMSRSATKLLKITFSDQTTLICTPEHPFFTQTRSERGLHEGWKKAIQLNDSRVLCLKHDTKRYDSWSEDATDSNEMCSVSKTDGIDQLPRQSSISESSRQLYMWSQMRGAKLARKTGRTHSGEAKCDPNSMSHLQKETDIEYGRTETNVQNSRIRLLQSSLCSENSLRLRAQSTSRTYAHEQSYAICNRTRENENNIACDRMETANTRRKWARSNNSTNSVSIPIRLADGSQHPVRKETDRISDLLQSRHREHYPTNRNRDRWSVTSKSRSAKTGSKTRSETKWVRVVNVEVYESTDPIRFREVCPDGLVYNIEVADLHNYVANGLVVHNCHKAPGELARFLDIWIDNRDLHKYANDRVREEVRNTRGSEWGRVGDSWLDCLRAVLAGCHLERHEILAEYDYVEAKAFRGSKQFRKLKKLIGDIERVVLLGDDDNWIWRQTRQGIAFNCIWAARYAERYLFGGVERVVLMSATLRPKLRNLLGIKETDVYFREWPRQFPPHLSPVYWLPGANMNKDATQEEMGQMIKVMDEIIESRRDRKGIIHTSSYDRAEWIQGVSRFGRYMILNDRQGKRLTATEAAEKFKNSNAPSLLVSPSYTTGYDFPNSTCEFQIIAKLPFADRSDPVTIVRCESDRDYYAYETMQTLVQACGRGSRHAKDRSETFIIDNSIGRFKGYAKHHAPKWFTIRKINKLPALPPKMEA